MSRLLSVFIALLAFLYVVIAIPIPRDNALELRDFSDEDIAHATRDYIDSLEPLDRRFKLKNLKGKFGKIAKFAKAGLSIAGKFNPAIGAASAFLGRREDDDEIVLRDVEDELAEELTLRDVDSLEPLDRRFKLKNLKGKFGKIAKFAKAGLSIAGKFNPAIGAASSFLGRREEDELAQELALRDVEDDEELLARDDEEFDVRDLSDDDLALTVRSVWHELSDVERRGIFESIKNAAARARSAVGRAANFVGAHGSTARQILGGAAGIAGKVGGRHGRTLSRSFQTANRFVGKAEGISNRLAYRDVEDEE